MSPIRWFRVTRGIPWRSRIRHHINLVRWTVDRCDGCGHRFAWRGDPRHGLNSKTYHGPCLSAMTWRTRAQERLEVLALVCEVWDIKASDARELMANRFPDGYESSNGWNRAWRVFQDLKAGAS